MVEWSMAPWLDGRREEGREKGREGGREGSLSLEEVHGASR